MNPKLQCFLQSFQLSFFLLCRDRSPYFKQIAPMSETFDAQYVGWPQITRVNQYL